MINDTARPTFPEALRAAMAAMLEHVHTATPAVVTAYDASSMRCSAQPLVMRARRGEDNARIAKAYPVCNGVPVLFPSGAGGRRFKCDIVPGDLVLLVFAESSIDRGFDRVHDPEDDRRHSLSDALAIPFMLSDAAVFIEVSDTEVNLGGGATEAALHGTAFKSAQDTFLTAVGVFASAVGAATPAVAGAAATLNTAITAFKTATAAALSTFVKVK